MCIMYNEIGSLNYVNSELRRANFTGFNNVDDILYFQKNFLNTKENIRYNHFNKIQVEKNELQKSISYLEIEMKQLEFEFKVKLDAYLNKNSNVKHKLNSKMINSGKILKFYTICVQSILDISFILYRFLVKYQLFWKLRNIKKNYLKDKKRFDFILNNFEHAVQLSAGDELNRIEQKLIKLNQLNTHVLGAIGEDLVVKKMTNLSDDCILINDFSVSFKPPIYRKKYNDYIKTIQIDHILVTGAGIFLIETKNWSNESFFTDNQYSPIDQIKRSNYAFYRFFNMEIMDVWGRKKKRFYPEKKITTRNLLVFIRNKPMVQHEFLKILNVDELLGYIQYFKPILNRFEIKEIAQCLLDFNSLGYVDMK